MADSIDELYMRQAISLAERGRGLVEPNPMVGCVLVRDGKKLSEGWHQRFGGPHAEIDAIAGAPLGSLVGATAYVSLEPCAHVGKTPPCVNAIRDSGITRVVAAMRDPFPLVNGGGIRKLQEAGVEVEVGILEREAKLLNAPYLKRILTGKPWVIAKWAMSLDGKLATRTGDSRWISSEASRRVVHEIRGRVDGVLVGRGTVEFDDPLLTARPPGPRAPVRIVLDRHASIASRTKLVQTARETPVLVVVGPDAKRDDLKRLEGAGCQIIRSDQPTAAGRLSELLDELSKRGMTNILVEGGAGVLGALLDLEQIDEAHVFVGAQLVGGEKAKTPIGGRGEARIADSVKLVDTQVSTCESDAHIRGKTTWGLKRIGLSP